MDDDLKELMENMKKDKDRPRKFWGPPTDKEGSFPIRIMPRVKDKGEKVFYFHHRVHWINSKAYECLKQDVLFGVDGSLHESEKCPVCDFVQKLYNTCEKGTEEWDLAGKLKAQDRYIYRIVVRGSEDETKPVFYEAGKEVNGIIYHAIAESDFGNITDLKSGRDFILAKTGLKRMSRYTTSSPSANVTPVFTDVGKIKSLIENIRTMEYTPLIEFTDFATLKGVLTAFINNNNDDDTGDVDTDKALTDKFSTPQASAKTETPVKSNDNIDDVLKDLGFDL
jgi:hypothetical protein